MPFRQSLASLIIISLIVLPPPVRALFGAGDIVFDPGNYQQNVLAAYRALQSNYNEARQIMYQMQQIANQVQQIKMEAQNLINFPAEVWAEVKTDIEQMRQLAQSTKDISTALQTLSTQFNEIYPGYQAPVDYQNEYLAWTNNSLKGIHKALEAANDQIKAVEAEKAQTQSIAGLSQNAVGHMQVLQAGNMLAVQMVNNLQDLRQLQMAEMQSQNAYLAAEVQNKASGDQELRDWIKRGQNYKSVH